MVADQVRVLFEDEVSPKKSIVTPVKAKQLVSDWPFKTQFRFYSFNDANAPTYKDRSTPTVFLLL